MKTILYPFVLLLFVISSCSEQKNPISTQTDDLTLVENLIERYQIASENEDFFMLENTWAIDGQISLIGTDSHEKLMGWQAIKNAFGKQFGLVSDMLIAADDLHINFSHSGTTAWFSQRMKYNFIYGDTAHEYDGLRLTGVADKTGGEWRLVQVHLSVPAQINIGRQLGTP
jgi:ketosteroid isomerase-like protein